MVVFVLLCVRVVGLFVCCFCLLVDVYVCVLVFVLICVAVCGLLFVLGLFLVGFGLWYCLRDLGCVLWYVEMFDFVFV